MIFQDSQSSLNPTKTIGEQVAEPVRLHRGASKAAARDRALEVLDLVGLPRPKERLASFPHELSGGQRQRVMIAIALACEPRVLIADEPTTALDVTIQAQILSLLDELRDRLGMATLLITHDMGVVAGRTSRVNVMYAGRLVETAPTRELFTGMRHPYTQGLLGSIPRLESDGSQALVSIPGLPPDLTSPPQGCRFAPRCANASDKCRSEEPPLSGDDPRHQFACWHPVDGPITRAPVIEVPARRRRPWPPSAWWRTNGHLLEISGVVREYPIHAGVAQAPGRLGQGRLRSRPPRRRRRDARAGRRVGLREDDARQADRRCRAPGRRADHRSAARRCSGCAAPACGARAATCR